MNWNRVGELLKIYSEGKPIPFKSVTVKLLEDIKMFLLRAPLGGNKKGTVSRNTASTYFAIVKAGVKQAFIDEYLTVDVSAKVKGIPSEDNTNVKTTQIYSHIVDSAKEKAANTIHIDNLQSQQPII